VCEGGGDELKAPGLQKKPTTISTPQKKHAPTKVFELAKNSLRAVHERRCGGGSGDSGSSGGYGDSSSGGDSGGDDGAPPVRVVVAEGDEDVTIKVSDEGGGIPRSGLGAIWCVVLRIGVVVVCVMILLRDALRALDTESAHMNTRPSPITQNKHQKVVPLHDRRPPRAFGFRRRRQKRRRRQRQRPSRISQRRRQQQQRWWWKFCSGGSSSGRNGTRTGGVWVRAANQPAVRAVLWRRPADHQHGGCAFMFGV
jgi:uncharacterized membrane protein YgcG